jgi:hypothetical protein
MSKGVDVETFIQAVNLPSAQIPNGKTYGRDVQYNSMIHPIPAGEQTLAIMIALDKGVKFAHMPPQFEHNMGKFPTTDAIKTELRRLYESAMQEKLLGDDFSIDGAFRTIESSARHHAEKFMYHGGHKPGHKHPQARG